MKKLFVLTIFALSCQETNKLRTLDDCNTPCFPEGTGAWRPDTGECAKGFWHCEGDQMTCVGAITPTEDICDGLDNNCDGFADEFLTDCCLNPVEEVCNGKDDDCDKQIDEDIPVNLKEDVCYSGELTSVGVGICTPGIMRCVDSQRVCVGEILPKTEMCNHVDDDCDGKIDEELTNQAALDLVFVVDNSGSMGNVIRTIEKTLNTVAGKYASRTNIRWALVMAPDGDYKVHQNLVHLAQQLGPTQDFQNAIAQQITYIGGGSAEEPTVDALYDICTANTIGLQWQPNSKKFILLFTDEHPQVYHHPGITHTAAAEASKTAGIPIFGFTSPHFPEWQSVPQISGGTWTNIYDSDLASDIEDLLEGIGCP